jgi:MFS family permease
MHDPKDQSLPPAFHRLTLSNLFAHTAEQVGLAATPIVAVLLLNAGAGMTAVLQAAQTLPFLLFSLPLGLLADRRSRTRLMAGGELVRALSLILVLTLIATGNLTLPFLAVVGFLGTVGTVAYTVTAPSLVTSLVPGSSLFFANGRIELVRSIAYASGPALGGALVGWTGATWAFALAIALSSGAVISLGGIPESRTPVSSVSRPFADMRTGIDFLLSHPLLQPVLVTAVIFNVSWFCLQGVYVAYAIQSLGHTTFQVGVVLAAYGGGMLAGAVAAPRITRNMRFGRVIVIGPLAGLAASLVMVLTIWTPVIVLPVMTYVLLGAGPIIWTISTTTLRQSVTPHQMLGRVSAVLTTATAGARPLGAGIGALIATVGEAEWCLIAAAGGFLLQALVILASATARLENQPSQLKHEFA